MPLWISYNVNFLCFDDGFFLSIPTILNISSECVESRVAGTLVALLLSVRVIAHLIPDQPSPLYLYIGKWLATMLAIKKLAGVAPEVDLREYALHFPLQKQIR